MDITSITVALADGFIITTSGPFTLVTPPVEAEEVAPEPTPEVVPDTETAPADEIPATPTA